MPTQTEIDDVLAKVATYQGKKVISDTAQAVASTASTRANAARAAFDAMVVDGETDETKLTTVLVAVSETAIDASVKQTDASAKSTEASQANTQLSDAIYALTIPPP